MASQKRAGKAPGSKRKAAPTTAFQIETEDGDAHVVGIGNLRVMLFNDDGSWFAQGLEIDYFAQGETLEEVQENFQDGLTATIDYHLKEHGNIQGILQVAPREAWEDFLANVAISRRYFHVSLHDGQLGALFGGVDFYQRTGHLAS
ncbi:MAG: hypothetical protein ABJC13_03370 [Acidobacteriota bacterium]